MTGKAQTQHLAAAPVGLTTLGARLRNWAAVLLVALAWLQPFAAGPSPQVVPWLTSLACALGLWGIASQGGARLPGGFALGAAILAGWAFVSHAGGNQAAVFLAAGLAVMVVSARAAEDATLVTGLQAGVLVAATLSAVIGLLQYFGLSEPLRPWVSAAEAGSAFGNLRQPNQYATLCFMGAAILVFGTLQLRRPAALGLMVLLATGCAAAVSRTALLEGVVLVLLAAWWGPGRRDRLLLCATGLAAYLAASWLLPLMLEAYSGIVAARTIWSRLGEQAGCASRLVLWSNVLHLIGERPLLGWGWGELDYAHFMTLYEGPRFCDILDNAHNLPLHLAVELGVPATALVAAGAGAWAWRQRPWRETGRLRQLGWALLSLMLVHSLLEYPLWYGPFQVTFGIAAGWLLSSGGEPDGRRGRAWAFAASLLLAGGLYAAWDYARVTQIYVAPEERRPAWADDTLAHVRRSWLFAGQAGFADLTLQPVTSANAPRMHALAQEVLHYSPEPRVVERLIESAVQLGREDEALLHLARYRAAFPREYEAWKAAWRRPLPP